MCKVYTGYCGTSEIEHGLCACTVDNPLAKARGLSLRTGAQTMLYLSHVRVSFCPWVAHGTKIVTSSVYNICPVYVSFPSSSPQYLYFKI